MESSREILENKDLLTAALKNKDAKKNFHEWLTTELTYTSNAIEGSTLTRQETVLAITENLTGGAKPIKDYQAAINHALAFNYVWKYAAGKQAIDLSTILAIHRHILAKIDDDHAGCYRTVAVRILGSRAVLPNPAKVADLMQEFDAWLRIPNHNVVAFAIEAHYRLVAIHPFQEGNGRTARLLMNLILLRAGYPPIIIRKIDRQRYLNALETWHTKGDREIFDKFMARRLAYSLKVALDLLNASRPNTNHQQLMTIGRFAKYVGWPSSKIRYWVQIGKFQPALYTDTGYMLFAPEQKQLLYEKGPKTKAKSSRKNNA